MTDESSDRHPLHDYTPQAITSWEQWQGRWEELQEIELRIGLLHSLFDISFREGQLRECIIFLLSIADGFTSSSHFYAMDGTSFGDARQKLAKKALAQLVKHVFADTNKVSDWPSWGYELCLDGVLEKVIWFFRVGEGFPERIRNLPDDDKDHDLIKLRGFARTFCRFCFSYPAIWRENGDELSSVRGQFVLRIEAERIKLLDLMIELDLLDLFLQDKYEPGEAVDNELERRALSNHHGSYRSPYNFDRQVRTIEESFALGSPTARVLMLRRIRRNVLAELDAEQEAQRIAEEAQRKLDKLRAGK